MDTIKKETQKELKKALAKNCKAVREQLHLSQTEIAEYLDTSHDVVHNWESGNTAIPGHVLYLLARLYSCHISDLYGLKKR